MTDICERFVSGDGEDMNDAADKQRSQWVEQVDWLEQRYQSCRRQVRDGEMNSRGLDETMSNACDLSDPQAVDIWEWCHAQRQDAERGSL